MSLSTLSFYCNRPTVIATLDLVTAITAEVQPKKDAEPLPTATDGKEDAQKSPNKEMKDASGPSDIGSKDGVGQEVDIKEGGNEVPQSISADADGVMTTINPKVVEDVDDQGNAKIAPKKEDSVVKGLLGKGKERVVFLLVLDMELAEIVLNKEDGSQLATLSQDNFHTDVKVQLSTSIVMGHHYFSIMVLSRLFLTFISNVVFRGISLGLILEPTFKSNCSMALVMFASYEGRTRGVVLSADLGGFVFMTRFIQHHGESRPL